MKWSKVRGMEDKISAAVEVLKNGGLVVMPSDTIYGIFCCAHDKKAIERLYHVRKREKRKACIVLLASLDELQSLEITLSQNKKKFLESLPQDQAITFILKSQSDRFAHIQRGLGSIACRIPVEGTKRGKALHEILKQTGPLLAPSANIAGMPPAQTIIQAQEYFGAKVDLYIDHGEPLHAKPSSIYDLTRSQPKKIR